MNNMLLMVIFGPIEVVMPLILTFLGLSVAFYLFSLFMLKREEKNVLAKGEVVYPETLFVDIEEMKDGGVLRLYSKRIAKNLFVITTSEITEEYRDGKFVSYASEKPMVLKAKRTSLQEFLKNFPDLNYKSMITRVGFQTRIATKQTDDKK